MRATLTPQQTKRYSPAESDGGWAVFSHPKPHRTNVRQQVAPSASSPSLTPYALLITHQNTHNQLMLCMKCDIVPAKALYCCLKAICGTNHPLVFYTVTQISSLSKWQRLRGAAFRHICVCGIWISPFEESNANAKWWGGRRSVCPYVQSGGLEGFRGLFPLRISFTLFLCCVLPASYRPTSKVSVETDWTGFYSWAFIL